MAISYVGGQVGGRVGAASTTTVTYALTGGSNATPQAGDFVVVTMGVGTAGRNPAQAVTAPATWANLGQLNPNTQTYDTAMNVSYKFMPATPDTNFTAPSTGNAQDAQRWTIQVFRGVDPTNPWDVAAVAASAVGTGRPDPGSITPVTAGAWVVICGAGAAATGAAYVAPANFTTNFLTGTTADTNDAMIGSGYWTGWTSGAVDPAQYTGGTANAVDSWAAYTLALRPASNNKTVALTGAQVAAQAGTVTKSNTGNVTLTGAQATASAGNVTASQANPNTPIRISTVLWQQDTLGTSGTPGAKAITVPADAQGVIVQVASTMASAAPSLSITSDFAGTFTVINSNDQDGCSIGYAEVTSTGSKNLTLAWTEGLLEGPSVYISFIKNINLVNWVRATLAESTGAASGNIATSISSGGTDLILVVDEQDGASGTPTAMSGCSTLGTTDGTYGSASRFQSVDNPSGGSTSLTGTATHYATMTAVSIKQSGGDVNVVLSGSQATASAGSVAASQQVSKALTGAQVAASAGNVTASQTNPNRPVRISTTIWRQDTLGTSGAPGAKAITVPADAQGVVVHFHSGQGGTPQTLSISSDFAGAFTVANSTTQNGCSLGYAAVSSTGAKNLTLAWTQTALEGPEVYISFIKNINTSDWVREVAAVGNDTNGTSATNVFDTSVDDLLLVVNDQDGGTAPTTISGFTSLATTDGTYSLPSRLQSCDSPGATTTTVTGTTTNFDVLSGISIKPSGGGVNVALTGAQVTASAGSVTPSQQVSKALSGSQATASAGTLTASQALTRTLTGAQVAASAGTVTPSQALTRALTGAQVAASAGTLTASQQVTKALTGEQVSALAGTVTPSQSTGNVDVALTGAQVAASAGSVTASQQVTKALTGAQVAASAGSVGKQISLALTGAQVAAQAGTVGKQISLALTGAQVAASAGTVAASQQVSKALTGAQVAAQAGTVGVTQSSNDVTVALTGAQVAASAGTVTPSQALARALTGAEITAQAGTLTTSQAVSAALTGAQVSASHGTLTASQQVTKALTGAQVAAQAGTVGKQITLALTGAQVNSGAGTITTSQTSFVALTGAQVNAEAGTLAASQQKSVALTGAQVAAQAGTVGKQFELFRALTGAEVTAQAGAVTSSQNITIALTGAQATAEAGALTTAQALTRALTGAQVSVQAGSLTAQREFFATLFGSQITAQAGSLTTSQALTRALVGSQAQARAGIVDAGVSLSLFVNIPLQGARVVALAGQFANTTGQCGYNRGRVVNE